MTYFNWSRVINGDPYSISLKVRGRTVEYTSIDWYADRGGVRRKTCGLNLGRRWYRDLVATYGQPDRAYTEIACTINND